MFKCKIVLGACLFAITASSLIGQEPVTPPFRYRVSEITSDHVVLILPEDSHAGRSATFRVGDRLPGSDWIITSLQVRIEKHSGINLDRSEVGLRDSTTGQEFIFKRGTEGLTTRSSEQRLAIGSPPSASLDLASLCR